MNSLKKTNKSRKDDIKIHTHPRTGSSIGLEKHNSPIQVGSVLSILIPIKNIYTRE
uniref:Uncharacterized protein n=1 Tax=Leclercia adecarboxylata TaxID=83655 RepID=A0A6H0A5V4_9ENTR|nr:hypothetical protein [Leclercia adecarboxylata]